MKTNTQRQLLNRIPAVTVLLLHRVRKGVPLTKTDFRHTSLSRRPSPASRSVENLPPLRIRGHPPYIKSLISNAKLALLGQFCRLTEPRPRSTNPLNSA